MNRVIMMGRLTKEPELRYTPNGVAVATFTLAVDRPKRQGEESAADFPNVVAWQKLADIVANYCRKGKRCLVEGRISTRSYDNKEGRKVYVTEVTAERVQIIDWPEVAGGGGSYNNDYDPFADAGRPININDDDLPF